MISSMHVTSLAVFSRAMELLEVSSIFIGAFLLTFSGKGKYISIFLSVKLFDIRREQEI